MSLANSAEPSYETFRRGPISGYCHPSLRPHLDFFIHSASGGLEDALKGQIIHVYLKRPHWVAAVRLPFDDLPHPAVLIKRFGSRSPLHRLLSLLTESSALRAFRMAVTLEKTGIKTPQPLLALETRHRGLIGPCYSITAWLPKASTAREILKSHPADSPEISVLLASLADATRRLHDAGILHRDLTLGNFLVSPDLPDRVYLVDLSRSLAFRSLSLILRLVDLARMNLGVHWPTFYRLYCKGHPRWLRYEKLLAVLVRLRRISIAVRKIKK